MIEILRFTRRPLLVAAGALMLAACGGGGGGGKPAPVSEGSTQGPRISAGSEVSEGDWTATVRTLGDPSVTSRSLSGSEVGASAAAQNRGTRAVATAGASSRAVNPAIVSLVNTANVQFRGGDYARAAATLERAIAIEPDNPWLWHRLAATRLAEGRLEQAAGLAAKSSSLAAADRSLQADNWKLIAEVRRRQGDAGAADAAEAQARKLAY